MKKVRLLTILAGATSVAASSTVWAGGFATARFGSEAGHPASSHVTSIYYNPAGLALQTGTRIYLEGLFAYRTISYTRPVDAIDEVGAGTPSDATGANSGEATLANLIASPFFGVVSDLGQKNLAVGAAFYVPFGGQAKYDKNDAYANDGAYPGAYDGPARWAGIEGQQRYLYATLAAAYKIPAAKLSVGINASFVKGSVSLVRARNADGTDNLVTPLGAVAEGRSLLEGDGSGIGIGGGLAYQPNDKLTVGASYQSSPGLGEFKLKGDLTNKFGAGPVLVTETELVQTLPDIIRLGGAFRASDSLEVRLSADYQRWSKFTDSCLLDASVADRKCSFTDTGAQAADAAGVVVNVMRNYDDTFGVRAGASYWASTKAEVFGSLAYDSNAVPDETMDSSLFDMNKVLINAGGKFELSKGLGLTAAVTQVVYFKRTVDARTTIPDPPSRNPDGAGTYKQSITFLTLGVEYGF